MKYLKYPLYLLLALLVIGLILTFLGPKNFDTQESVEIEAPASIIYGLTNSLKKTSLWNDWTLSDTTIQTTYNDVASGVGASSSWTSSSGNGTQKIIESVANQKVRSQLNFEGFSGDNFADVSINPKGESQEVTWTFEGAPLPWYFRGIALVSGMKKGMKKSYKKGLENLKKIAEERGKGIYGGHPIKEQMMDERHFIMKRSEIKGTDIQQYYTTNLGSLFMSAQKGGLIMKGMPHGLYFSYPQNMSDKVDLGAAIPIAESASVAGATTYTIPAKQAVMMDFYGDYNNLGTGHEAILDYMTDRGYSIDLPFTEEYANDPTQVDDPSKILTKITYYYTSTE